MKKQSIANHYCANFKEIRAENYKMADFASI